MDIKKGMLTAILYAKCMYLTRGFKKFAGTLKLKNAARCGIYAARLKNHCSKGEAFTTN